MKSKINYNYRMVMIMNNKKTEINLSAFGKLIRTERLKKNLTQECIAEKSDISANYLGKIERGEDLPSLKVAYSISRSLNVGLDYLLNENNLMLHEKNSVITEIDRQLNELTDQQKLYILEAIKLYIHYQDKSD